MDKSKKHLRIYLTIFFAVMISGTIGFMLAENLSLADAIYFSIVTVATVGYGDISPATQLGKILAIILIFTGVGTFLGVIANATEIFLNRRETEHRNKKLQMILGLFFSETGNRLLRYFVEADSEMGSMGKIFVISPDCNAQDFVQIKERARKYPFNIDVARIEFANLRDFLNDKSGLLIQLMENPYLLEHETFTDLLISILHLKEELLHRPTFEALPASDMEHLTGDINRVYALLVDQWLDYLGPLKDHYPFLFSLALRTNPFDTQASVIVK